MKSVMISIKPKYCELIASGSKTIEVRKTKPKLKTPFKCYIYCTKERMPIKENGNILMYEDDLALTNRYGQGKRVENPNGAILNGEVFLNSKVIGEFVCDNIFPMSITYSDPNNRIAAREFPYTCLTDKQIIDYLGNGKRGYGWHISDLIIYDKPKELSEFKKINRECWYADLGLAKRDCSKCKDENCLISRPPQSWCYVEGTVYCKDCKHLMFSDCYAECGKGYKGIVSVDNFCDKGELR